MPVEMLEEDYKLTPSGRLGGRTSVSTYKFLREFDTNDEALEFVRQDMEDNQFWPNIWWVSDHGNYWLIDLDGNEIHVEDDEEDVLEDEEEEVLDD